MEYEPKVLQKGKGQHVAIEWQCLQCGTQFVYYAEDSEPHFCPARGIMEELEELEGRYGC
jgi:hypothetical protein